MKNSTADMPIFAQIKRGFLLTIPVGLIAAVYGSVLGVLAAAKEISLVQLIVMDISIFAGTAQFVMVDMWKTDLPIFGMAVSVLIMNFRYFLIGASVKPLFSGQSLLKKLLIIHLTVDENWALTMREFRKGTASVWFLLGGGVCLIIQWTASTVIGLKVGEFIQNPEKYALDFVIIAVFTALTESLYRGKKDIIPFCVSAAVAVFSSILLPGKWYIAIGAVAGAATAIFSSKEVSVGTES